MKDFEPLSALDGGEDGLDFYRTIAAKARGHLNDGGVVLLELGAGQADAVSGLFAGFDTEITEDMQGVRRILSARMKNEDK